MKMRSATVLGFLVLAACGDDPQPENNTSNNNPTNNNTTVLNNPTNNGSNNLNNPQCNAPPATHYTFIDENCADTVAYVGQVGRQILIKDLSSYMLSLEGQIDAGTLFPEEGQVVAALDFYFRFDGDASGDETIRFTTEPPLLADTYALFGTGKDLVGKLAGNDASTDHQDWSTSFRGWNDATLAEFGGTIETPEGMVQAIFAQIEQAAINRANGTFALDPVTQAPLPLHVTAKGQDLQQLVEKFLHTALGFSQGADDYLDDDVPGKGLLASNDGPDGENPWTPLAHQWDEGFGYFGGARNYVEYTDDEIAGAGGREDWQGYHDINGDGRIDLLTEYNFAASGNAAKRDRGAAALGVDIDLTADVWAGFRDGRALIASIEGPLSEAQLDELRTHRDKAVLGWEKTYMATVLHYINKTLQEIETFGTADYSLPVYAKVWSEAKGFAFAPLFNRSSPMTSAQFDELHASLGDFPVAADAPAEDIQAYQEGLRAARQLLADAYGFDVRLIGEEDGSNGW